MAPINHRAGGGGEGVIFMPDRADLKTVSSIVRSISAPTARDSPSLSLSAPTYTQPTRIPKLKVDARVPESGDQL